MTSFLLLLSNGKWDFLQDGKRRVVREQRSYADYSKEHFDVIHDAMDNCLCIVVLVCKKIANKKNMMKLDELKILQKNYAVAEQVIPHFHAHLIPCFIRDGIGIGHWNAKEAPFDEVVHLKNILKLNN